jgi:glycosyltransferase involved in cell wall biosynthesis
LTSHIGRSRRNVEAADKPALLMAIYAHADYFPPTINAARILSGDFRVQVVCRNTEAPPVEWHPEVKIERVGPLRSVSAQKEAGAASKLVEFSRYVRVLGQAVSRSGAKIIYAYDPIAFAAAMLARPSGVPVVFHCHDIPDFESLSNRSLQTWLIRYALKRTHDAALVVFPERHRAECWSEAAGGSPQTLIVPNGASRRFVPDLTDSEDLAAIRWTCRNVFYFGWLSEENAELMALQAAKLDPSIKLTLLGTVSRALQLRLPEFEEGNRIVIRAWDPGKCIALMRSSAIGLVLYKPTSLNWEFSASAVNKLFQYGAAGLPVVVPNRRSYREFLGDEKWVAFADIEDPRSIARAIEYILDDRDRYLAMSRAAREAHEKRFNYELLFAPVVERLRAMAGIGDRVAAA